MDVKDNLAVHVWNPKVIGVDPFRIEFQSIANGSSFGFDITPECLARMLFSLADIMEKSKENPEGYSQLVFDITDTVELTEDELGNDLE